MFPFFAAVFNSPQVYFSVYFLNLCVNFYVNLYMNLSIDLYINWHINWLEMPYLSSAEDARHMNEIF